jgi:3-deoxy-D-manno-octulosonic-acid transferase
MFKYIYYTVALVIYILTLPYLYFKSKNIKYKISIPAKFFLKNNPKFQPNKIWFHSCSHGETNSLQPLFDMFDKDDINLSVMTNTGFEQAKKIGIKNIRYLPFEIFLPFWITKQKLLIVTEAELWYMLFLVAKSKNIPTILINARISDRSYKNYQKFSFLYKHIFQNIDKIFAQTSIDKQRLESLGAKDVTVAGNIKLYQIPTVTKEYKKPNKTIFTAGSTHQDEEILILDSFNFNNKNNKLIIVPRHPERFDEVYDILKNRYENSNITYHRFSQQENFNSDIVLIDKMGELNNIYAISDVVILGGSFIANAGGHNPIEPAFFKTKLISGETIFNQKALFEYVDNCYLISNNQLKEKLHNIDQLKNSSLSNNIHNDIIKQYLRLFLNK